jgi:tetratricopeptide (TPR) repeat protein
MGRGVERGLKLSAEYYRRAALGGDPPSQVNWGVCLEFGKGVDLDCEAARLSYQNGAAQEFPRAEYCLGFCLEHGIGVEADPAKAATYYKRAADHLSPAASYQYALCLHVGRGVEADLEEAVRYYERAISLDLNRVPLPQFRCRRAAGTAKFSPENFPDLVDEFWQPLPRGSGLKLNAASGMLHTFLIESMEHTTCERIGVGGAGTVFSVDGADGSAWAMKEFKFGAFGNQGFLREAEALVKLRHPCILRVIACSMAMGNIPSRIYTELAKKGSLYDLLMSVRRQRRPPFWNPTGIAIFICGIVLGMRFVHRLGWIHIDLKPRNILVSDTNRALISDFGSGRLEDDDITITSDTGTVYYAAPELYHELPYPNKIDVFSFGLILFEILVGRAVFEEGEQPFPIMKRLREGDFEEIPPSVGDHMQTLISQCWSVDPEKRPSFDDIFRGFEQKEFDVFPNAEALIVREYAREITDEEDRYLRTLPP